MLQWVSIGLAIKITPRIFKFLTRNSSARGREGGGSHPLIKVTEGFVTKAFAYNSAALKIATLSKHDILLLAT